jgi:O-acetyl-ADP-ribose deacetylase (regulator of RNase III)
MSGHSGARSPVRVTVEGAVVEVARGDITRERADAVVNAANASLAAGGGVDGALRRAAGPALEEACRRVSAALPGGRLPPGGAVLTEAGQLPARCVIHAVGPIWQGGGAGEQATLARAYGSTLDVAAAAGCATVSFPSIATGAYGFPVEQAAAIALSAIAAACWRHPARFRAVRLLLFSDEDFQAYASALRGLGV